MKTMVSKKNLLEGLQKVSKSTTKGTLDNIMKGVFIEAEGNSLILRGTDLDISIESIIEAEVIESGKILVDCKLLLEIIRKLADGDISMEDTENDLSIICGKSNFTVMKMNEKEFPAFPKLEEYSSTIKVNAETLKQKIQAVSFAAAKDESRPILQGILFELKQNTLTLVALDGYRMSISKVDVESNSECSCVLNGTHSNVVNILEKEIEISFSNNHIVFASENLKVICRLLEGNYVNYSALINVESKFNVKITKDNFLGAIERAALVGNVDQKKFIKLLFDKEKEIMQVTSNSSLGKSKEDVSVSIEKLTENFEIAFNANYLLDVLKNTSSNEFTLGFNSSVNPVTIKDGDGNFYVVLPIRITK